MKTHITARLAIALLVVEIFVRHVTGIAGIIFPHAGIVVQQSLIIWGLTATIFAVGVVSKLPRDISLPTLGALAILGAAVGARIPLSAGILDTAILGFGTWSRLALPIASMTVFAASLESSIRVGEAQLRRPRSQLVLVIIGVGTAAIYAWLRATGSAWSWSPQQPVPYLVLAALGATGVGWLLIFTSAGVLVVLSLKRSAAIALMALVLIAPRPALPKASRVPAGLVSLIAALLVGAGVYMSPAAEIIRTRTLSGLEQLHDVAKNELPDETSLQVRVVEHREALALWGESPATVLFGTAVARELRSDTRASATVHNTYLSALQLGGITYIAVVVLFAMSLRHRFRGLRRPQGYRWYFAGAAATLIEAVAGNSLLTVTLGASLALLIRAPGWGLRSRPRHDQQDGRGAQKPKMRTDSLNLAGFSEAN